MTVPVKVENEVAVTSAPQDYALEVARGNIPGVAALHKFGTNTEIDSGVTADIWDGGYTVASSGDSLIWVPPTTARIHQIVSSSVNDDGAPMGTGAHIVEIFGLDASFALQDEKVTLNGTTNVATAKAYTMIHRVVVRQAGSGETNAGDIKATADTDNTVTARIRAGKGQTQMAIYQVPADKTAYLTEWNGHLESAGGAAAVCDLYLYVKPFGEVYQIQDNAGLAETGNTDFEETFNPYRACPPKALMKVQATSGTNNNEISASFDLYLVDNN